MAKLRWFYEEMYNFNVDYVRCSRKVYDKLVKARTGLDAPVKHADSLATYEMYPVDDSFVHIVWLNADSGVSQLAHECFHVAHSILQDRGMKLSDDSEEAYAYLIQFLFNKMKVIC